MISKLIAKSLAKIAGIKVIHGIPGRLRISFTGASKAREYFSKQKDIPQCFYLYKLKGIQSFEFNPVTSRALIVYDAGLLSEKEILAWLKRLQELIIQNILKGGMHISQLVIDQIASQLKAEGYELEKFEQRTTS